MSAFAHYARYYDLLYRDKDYGAEAKFVSDQLLKSSAEPGSVLELGCGTGKHAIELAKLGWSATGYDLSESMVKLAMERTSVLTPELAAKLKFSPGDVRTLADGNSYDAVVSLFHVMSYQTTDEDLYSAFATAATHLKPGGKFFFDFWYGPAVLSDPPAVRIKRLEDEKICVTRLAEPAMRFNENVVLVNYDVFVQDKKSGLLSEMRETHCLRYMFLPELKRLLQLAGFHLCSSGPCYSENELGGDSWFGWLVAEKTFPGSVSATQIDGNTQ